MEWVYAYKRDVIPYLLLYWVILVYSLGQRWYVQTLTCRKEKDENKKKNYREYNGIWHILCHDSHVLILWTNFVHGPLDLFQRAVAADLNTKVKWTQ